MSSDRWWLIVGWLRPTGSVRSHAQASSVVAIIDSNRSRTGSASSLNAVASSSASDSDSTASPMALQQTSITFRLFATEPAKVRPGYANFAVADPPLKLVLIENAPAAGSLNHLGVEVASTDEVTAAQARLARDGLDTTVQSGACCYAVQDKVWVTDPDAAPWEIYTVLADADVPHTGLRESADQPCCAAPVTAGGCC